MQQNPEEEGIVQNAVMRIRDETGNRQYEHRRQGEDELSPKRRS